MSEGSLFQLHVGVQVDLGRFRRFVAQPESNDAEVDASMKQRHSGRVAQGVWGYSLGN